MNDCIDNDQAERAAQARRALDISLSRLQSAGFECELTKTRDGAYERIALSYSRAGQDRHVITDCWVIGERDNESLAYTCMTLEALRLAGAHQ